MAETERRYGSLCLGWGFATFLVAAGTLTVIAGCGGGSGGGSTPPVTPTITSVSVSCSPASILTNQTSACTPTVSGTGAYSSSVTWSVSPTSIGAVSGAGVFTPAGAGTATITATSTQDTTKSGNATVTVTSPPTITSVSVVCSPISILTTQTSACTPTVSGTGAYSSSVTWSVSPTSIGAVSSAGVFTPAGAGTATITATSTQDTTKSGNATVTVTSPPTITSVSVVCSPISILTTQTSACTPTVSGTGAYSSSVTWSVSPTSIGAVSGAGVFTPAGAGTATITATSTQDTTKSGNATVTVAVPATITVNISGLPAGVNANVTVAGPAGFSQQLTQTAPLSLAPGIYTFTAAIVSSSSIVNTVYIPAISGSPTTVTANGSTTVTITYGTLQTLWQAVGPSAVPVGGLLFAGKIQALAIDDQNPLVMYAGGGSDRGTYTEPGLYKTVDGGKTWTQINTGLTDPAIDELWLDQNNPNVILAGSYGLGIFRSADAGAHWTPVGSYGQGLCSDIVQVGGTIYVGTPQGIAESTDDGLTWNTAEAISYTQLGVRSLSAGGGAIYAGLGDGQVLVKLSSTANWVTTTPAANSSLTAEWSVAVNPNNPSNAFVIAWHNYQTPSLYETTNGGTSWQPVVNGLSGFVPQTVYFDPVSSVLYSAGDEAVYQSPDDGSTWAPVSGVGWNSRLVVTNAGGVTGNLILGGDSGLFMRPNGSTTWQSLNGNMITSSSTSFDVSGSTIIARVQDQPPYASFDSGATWQQSYGGEGGYAAFNPGNPLYAYSFDLDVGFQYSNDGGHTFTPVPALPASSFSVLTGTGDLVAFDTKNPSTMYVATPLGIYKSTDWGVDWALQSWPATSAVMVAVDPTNSNKIFVGTGQIYQPGSLQVTTDGGNTWTTSNLNVPPDCSSPISLAVDAANPSVVFVGMSAEGVNPSCGILRSTDGGNTFTLVNNGTTPWARPGDNGAIPAIRFDPAGSGIVAVAHQSGLYISSDLGNNWTSIHGNAAPYETTGVTWSGGYIYASTDGEGVIRMPFSF